MMVRTIRSRVDKSLNRSSQSVTMVPIYWVSNPEDLPLVVVSEPTVRGHDSYSSGFDCLSV